MNAVKHTLVRCRQVTRSFSSSSSVRSQDMAKFKEKQRLMQIDDGVPVHLKKGASDRLIFAFICIGMGTLACMSASTLYKMVYPPRNN